MAYVRKGRDTYMAIYQIHRGHYIKSSR